ncbi:hypothetical protein [Paenibacillus turpanensis]|uniref:hypothetical protein n=1 Tax=Paenibacillus turpanensis TaxID=2689078 RepID=UPI00140E6B3C|nr:hypothetical protein [Paenibacillus turpanensis]
MREWTKGLKMTTAAVIGMSMLASLPAHTYASAGFTASAPAVTAAAKVDAAAGLKAELKHVLAERNEAGTGTNLGASLRFYNTNGRLTRMPEGHLRLRTADGASYILQPSAANPRAASPYEMVELSFYAGLEAAVSTVGAELQWVDVNEYVYPKTETVKWSIPLTEDMVWTGALDTFADSASQIAWGTAFRIPFAGSQISLKPEGIRIEQTAQGGQSYIVTFTAVNEGNAKEKLPDFQLRGRSGGQTFVGTLAEQTGVMLEPGESKAVHVVIPVNEGSAVLSGITVETVESFVPAAASAQQAVRYAVGRMSMALPPAAAELWSSFAPYEMRQPMKLTSWNKAVADSTEVALMELTLSENEGSGYQTAVAKFKLTNTSGTDKPMPQFGAELTGTDGHRYTGSRQTASYASMAPGLSYVISYSFLLPESETGEALGLALLEPVGTGAAASSRIAAVRTAAQPLSDSKRVSMYPFDIEFRDWTTQYAVTQGPGSFTYTYMLKVNAQITHQDDVVADQQSSMLKFELYDSLGRVFASKTMPLVGEQRIVSGTQTLRFSNVQTEQLEYPYTVKVYETFQTPAGEAKRLLAEWK